MFKKMIAEILTTINQLKYHMKFPCLLYTMIFEIESYILSNTLQFLSCIFMSSMDPLQSWSGSADRALQYKTNPSQFARYFYIVHCKITKGSLFVPLSVKMFFVNYFWILQTGMKNS